MPEGFRAEDGMPKPDDSMMLPLPKAAAVMGMSEEAVTEWAAKGYLTGELRGRTLYVEPAVVTVLSVPATASADT